MSLLDPILSTAGPAVELATTGDPVNVGAAQTPVAGDVLTAVDETHAVWAPPTGGGGGEPALLRAGDDWDDFGEQEGAPNPSDRILIERAGDGEKATIQARVFQTTSKLATNSDPVDIGASAPPDVGHVLMAIGPTQAQWAPVPGAWSVPASINPRHWWRADNTVQSGGLVDTIVDNGRAGTTRNMAGVGAGRCATALDTNGKTYLNFAVTRYQAGAQADWMFLSNGAAWTIAAVLDKQALGAVGTIECLLATCFWGSGSPGMMLGRATHNNSSGSSPTPIYFWDTGIMGSNGSVFAMTHGVAIARTGMYIIVVTHNGYSINQGGTGIGWLNNPVGCSQVVGEMWENGRAMARLQTSPLGRGYTSGNPAGPLTLGQYPDAGPTGPIAARVYELMIHDRALTQWDIERYTRDAATRYGVAL